jgi:NTP pyrophosphatase (non-canonical NTP hydrolase)
MLKFNQYEAESRQFILPQVKDNIEYFTLGLCSEAGEVADKIKKQSRDGTVVSRKELAKELGDVLWYVTAIANIIGVELEAVAVMNLNKLKDRQARNKINGSGDNR